MSVLATLALCLIAASAALQAFLALRGRSGREGASHWLLLAAAACLVALAAYRTIAMGFPALTGTFESLAFYAMATCLICFAYRVQRRLAFLPLAQFGATIVAGALLCVASSPLAPKELLAPLPALRSGWLVAHVALSLVGEAFFVVGFVASIAYLASRDEGRRTEYDRLAYTSIALGFPIFTTGALVFGMIWAQRAWGSWWSWDPKETWALATWLVYTLYLHLRLARGKRGALTAWASVLGFLCTAFTFFGVNFLLAGLHSYR
jgi:ABC-type transport system involved in cytochrome c biogenesis permease subunit